MYNVHRKEKRPAAHSRGIQQGGLLMPVKIKHPVHRSQPELRKLDGRQAALTEAKIRLDELHFDPCHLKRR